MVNENLVRNSEYLRGPYKVLDGGLKRQEWEEWTLSKSSHSGLFSFELINAFIYLDISSTALSSINNIDVRFPTRFKLEAD